jgi:glycosyltransferase involved in cell wall biosynthesis
MTVLYYTSTSFLDIAVEVISILKKDVDLHVLIEVTSVSASRIEAEKLPDDQTIIGVSELLNEKSYKSLQPYFEGCASSNFIVHSSKTGFSFSTLKVTYELYQYIKRLRPDIIHLEVISLRSLGLIPFLFSKKKIFITIHDSIPHSGLNSWKLFLPRLLFLITPYPRSYFFYSEFSKNQFEQHYKNDRHPKYVKRMYPYTFYNQFAKEGIANKKHILFFGSIALYKGIETLIQAMPSVLEKFPDECLIIAGHCKEGYSLNEDILKIYQNRITIINRYIPNEELVTLIQESKLVVCPYLDATQSGVLMTAFALNIPVIATNVGAFPEYIEQNKNGMLVPVNDPDALAKAIMSALINNFYKTMGENIKNNNISDGWANNKSIILKAYLS